MVYKKVDELYPEHRLAHKLTIDDNQKVIDIHNEQKSNQVYMDMYLIEKSFMKKLIEECIAHGSTHFFLDGIKAKLHDIHIHAYEYKEGYALINSIESYYRHSKSLLNEQNHDALFKEDSPIYTKVKNEAPSKYLTNCEVKNALVANGCVIEGQVEDSILFRGVKVGKGAVIKNSIIMQKCDIGSNVILENVILDKDCKISSGRRLVGDPEKPYVIAKTNTM